MASDSMVSQLIVDLVFTFALIWNGLIIQLLIEATSHNFTGNFHLCLALVILWTIEDILWKMKLCCIEGSMSVRIYQHSSPRPSLTYISVRRIV